MPTEASKLHKKLYMKAYHKSYREKHRDALKERDRIYHINNKEKYKTYGKAYRENNRGRCYTLEAQWRKENLLGEKYERYKKVRKAWKIRNKDRLIKYAKDARNTKNVKAREVTCNMPTGIECSICKDKKTLQKHHWDYNRPLLFSTLCLYCHEVQHVRSGQNYKGVGYAELTPHF